MSKKLIPPIPSKRKTFVFFHESSESFSLLAQIYWSKIEIKTRLNYLISTHPTIIQFFINYYLFRYLFDFEIKNETIPIYLGYYIERKCSNKYLHNALVRFEYVGKPTFALVEKIIKIMTREARAKNLLIKKQ